MKNYKKKLLYYTFAGLFGLVISGCVCVGMQFGLGYGPVYATKKVIAPSNLQRTLEFASEHEVISAQLENKLGLVCYAEIVPLPSDPEPCIKERHRCKLTMPYLVPGSNRIYLKFQTNSCNLEQRKYYGPTFYRMLEIQAQAKEIALFDQQSIIVDIPTQTPYNIDTQKIHQLLSYHNMYVEEAAKRFHVYISQKHHPYFKDIMLTERHAVLCHVKDPAQSFTHEQYLALEQVVWNNVAYQFLKNSENPYTEELHGIYEGFKFYLAESAPSSPISSAPDLQALLSYTWNKAHNDPDALIKELDLYKKRQPGNLLYLQSKIFYQHALKALLAIAPSSPLQETTQLLNACDIYLTEKKYH